jgi:hypothetical protein
MAKLAAGELEGIKAEASDIELIRGGSSYTADTAEELSRLIPAVSFGLSAVKICYYHCPSGTRPGGWQRTLT